MPISPISFRADASKANIQQKEAQLNTADKKTPVKPKSNKKSFWNEMNIKEPPPIAVGMLSAALWFGLGSLMDKGLSKIWKGYNYSAKTSMYMNGAFGLIMGTMDFFRARSKY